jgi:hypothetical protein
MSPKRRKKRGSGTVKSGARKARTRKPVRTKPRGARPKKAAGKALHKVSAKKRATVFRQINRVLKKHGIAGTVAAMHFESAALEPCPPDTIRRVVCRRQPSGTIKCEELCVPV